jgi:hypothetical protein
MRITLFEISENRQSIKLEITDARDATSLRLWTEKTYKNTATAIDLTLKLTGAEVESIIIRLADLNIPYFDGIYFIEAEDPDGVAADLTSDLTRYKECLLTKVVDLMATSDCLKVKDSALINAQTLLVSLQTAVDSAYTEEVLLIAKVLNRYCSNTCRSCGEYTAIQDNSYYES